MGLLIFQSGVPQMLDYHLLSAKPDANVLPELFRKTAGSAGAPVQLLDHFLKYLLHDLGEHPLPFRAA